MNKVLLMPNPKKDPGLAVSAQLAQTLYGQGFELLMGDHLAPLMAAALPLGCKIQYMDSHAAMAQCDFALVVGGDGSILSVAASAAKADKPILGVNMGTLGFMSELEVSEIDMIGRVKQKDFTLDYRAMLLVEVIDEAENTVYSAAVLNEAVVNKGVESKIIRLTVRVDGEDTLSYSGDGVIVATPTGSTAYSLAAGGPILAPGSPCVAVTPICPLTLNVKSFVIDRESRVEIVPHFGGQRIYLSPDGFESQILKVGQRVVIRKAPERLSLIRLKGIGFYQRVSMKLSK